MGDYSQERPWRRVRVVNVGAVPGAGADWLVTCPAGKVWRVLSAYSQLTSSATTGQRLPRLQVGDGTATFLDVPPVNGQQASIAHRYAWTEHAGPWQATAGQPTSLLASAVSTVGAGTVLTYTVPTGGMVILTSASWFLDAGTPPTMQLQLIRGATTYVLQSGAASVFLTPGIPLQGGDVIRWQCTVGGAGSSVDATLSGEPSTLAGIADGETIAIPDLLLQPGWTIGTLTDNLAAGDQWTAPRLYVIETTVRPGPIPIDMSDDVAEALTALLGL